MTVLSALALLLASYLPTVQGGRTCSITHNEKCNLNKFPVGKSVMISPGGATTCLKGDPYSFQVIRGTDPTKLVFHFQGGGACWDSATIAAGACWPTASPEPMVGILDRKSPTNKFKDYNVILVTYCTGDLHVGNFQWNYWDLDVLGDATANQRGAVNFRAVFTYLQSQQRAGTISTKLNSLFLSGSSAGSLGVQFYSGFLLSKLSATKVSVVADSFAGVGFATGTLPGLLKNYGVCGLLPTLNQIAAKTLVAPCRAGNLVFNDIVMSNMRTYPKVPFCFIQSMHDEVQMAFFDGENLLDGSFSSISGPNTFFSLTLTLFQQKYNTLPNFVVYFIDDDTHQYLTQSWYDKASILGSNGPPQRPMLYDWVNRLPLNVGANITTVNAPAPLAGKVFLQTSRA